MKSIGVTVAMGLWCACGLGVTAHAEDPETKGSTVLESLKNYDSIFESGFTLSGTWRSNDIYRFRPRLTISVQRSWRMTYDGKHGAHFRKVLDYEKPAYQEKLLYKPNTDMLLTVRTTEWGYWGPDFAGFHYEDTDVNVNPSGEAAEGGVSPGTSKFSTKDSGPTPPQQIVLWSMGRFFSRHLDKIAKVEKSKEGLLVVSASGKMGQNTPGRWELEIEPDAAWMVRKARFYSDRFPNAIGAEMTNSGTVWDKAHCIPKEAVCNYFGTLDESNVMKLTFNPVVEPFNQQLFSDSREAMVNNKDPRLIIHDYSVTPPVTLEPNRPEPAPTSPPPLPVSPARTWFILANVVIGIAFLAFFLARKRRTNDTQGRPVK